MLGGGSCVPAARAVGVGARGEDESDDDAEAGCAGEEMSSSSSSSSSEASAAVSTKLCLAGADLRRGVVVLALGLVALGAGRGGLNAGRPRLAMGLEVGGIVVGEIGGFGSEVVSGEGCWKGCEGARGGGGVYE